MATIEFSGIRLRPMRADDQAQVLAWRSNPELTRVMYTDLKDADIAHQMAWFERIAKNPAYEYWMIENRGATIGVANLAATAPAHGRTDWAFYLGDPSARGTGAGAKVEYAVIYYVFFHRKLRKLCCQVLSNNMEVVELHRKFGFVDEGVLRSHFCRNGSWLDVYLLALHENVARERGYDRKKVFVEENHEQ